MAVKKTPAKATATKAAPKKVSPKKASPKKAEAAKAPAAATKAAAPKKSAPTKAPAADKAAAPKKKAAPVKLTDKQVDILKKVGDTKEAGYLGSKAEGRTLEALQTRKLIKRGAKDKASGSYRFSISKTGEKHLSTPAPTAG